MMSRSFSPAILVVGVAALCFACSDQLPPLPDSGGVTDGATHDVSSADMGPGVCYDNSGCAPTAYCQRDAGCDGPGACVERPTIGCEKIYLPECGCDGQTYGNACEAASAGVNIRHPGECASTTGCTHSDECSPREFCNVDYDCDARGQLGTCELIPEGCTYESNPVCGCNNVDYPNPCQAHAAGTSVLHDGLCGGVDPTVCEELDADYRATLSSAKACLFDGTMLACDYEVQDALACGCPTYITSVDPNRTALLDQFWIDWAAAGCNLIDYACHPCVQPSGADCSIGSDGVGMCVDSY